MAKSEAAIENKRILVNSQLRLLFNLPNIHTESGEAIKRLQNAINNSISALKIHDIDVTNWDCILIFLCSTRLPKLTLSLWEQSVRSKTEIPRSEDFSTFLTGRYQTLEKVSDFRTTILDGKFQFSFTQFREKFKVVSHKPAMQVVS